MFFFDNLMDFISRFAFAGIIHVVWVLLGEIINAHQHGIIRRSQQVQRFLHLPMFTHIFSEADTEIHHDDIKISAIALSFPILFVSSGTLDILIESPTSALSWPLSVCYFFGLIVTPGLVLWLRLALTCRRRQKNRMDVAWDIEDIRADGFEVARCTGADENTALLLSHSEQKAESSEKVEDKQSRQDGPSKSEVERAGKASRGDKHSNAYASRVS